MTFFKSHKIKRCPCGRMLRSHNQSGLCSKCHGDVYGNKKNGGMKQNGIKN